LKFAVKHSFDKLASKALALIMLTDAVKKIDRFVYIRFPFATFCKLRKPYIRTNLEADITFYSPSPFLLAPIRA